MWRRPQWTRGPASYSSSFSVSSICRRRPRPTPRRQLLRPDAASLLPRELTDVLPTSSSVSTSCIEGSSTPTRYSSSSAFVVNFTLPLPFQGLAFAYALHPACHDISSSHALLFEALTTSPDLLQHQQMPNPTAGALIDVRLRGVALAFATVAYYRADIDRLFKLPPQVRCHVEEMRLLQLVSSTSPNAELVLAQALKHGSVRAGPACWTLLSMPCRPPILRLVLHSMLQHNAADGLTGFHFQQCMHALLSNDNFFCEEHFLAMHQLVMELVLPAVQEATRRQAFDFLAVRWTILMNKWARVYTKSVQGFLLYDCFCAVRHAAPAAETKMPASFYIRLLGALLDASMAVGYREEEEATAVQGWGFIQAVTADALRLFGRNTADHHAIWILLLKAALTLSPPEEDACRLLAAYHLCVVHGHPVQPDRQGFLQVVRLVSAAVIATSSAQQGDANSLMDGFCAFVREQAGLNFLWLLDGIGTLLTGLWEAHGLAAADAAAELVTVLEQALRRGRISGVNICTNPVIARAMSAFHLGGPTPFWWTCGCGEVLPAPAKRCSSCLRSSSSSSSWQCPTCHASHRSVCGVQPCSCGAASPRMAAASQTDRSLCPRCGGVTAVEDGGRCRRCEVQQHESGREVECAHCHERYSGNALHCPQCYTVAPAKAPLYVWHCTTCDGMNYSIWSSCRTCRTPRKTCAFTVPFVPWRCGCGALNPPGRLRCGCCASHANANTFTCCRDGSRNRKSGLHVVEVAALRPVPLTVDRQAVPVHACPSCGSLHPRSDGFLRSPQLTRHCRWCAKPVAATSIGVRGHFYHCDVVQTVNENIPFRCGTCASDELQTGYHCHHCLFPRPELAAAMAGGDGNDAAQDRQGQDQQDRVGEEEDLVAAVWRCLHESKEGELCGQWNYGWCGHCISCGTGRPDSPYECRAKARLWRCDACGHTNRPIDVLFCAECKRGLQPMLPCTTCGVPHLSYACRVHLS